jgi:hypothetical protein
LAAQLPELGLPAADDAAVGRVAGALCAGRVRVGEVRGEEVWAMLLAELDGRQRAALRRDAPVRVDLPSDRSVRIDYGAAAGPTVAAPLQELPIPTRPYPPLPGNPIPGNPTQPLETEPVDSDEVIAVRDPGMIESQVKVSSQRPASRSPLDVADTGAGNLVPVENLRAKPPVYQPASLKSLLSKSKVRPEPQRAVITWETTTAALEIDTPALSDRLRRIARIQGFDPLPLESISDESAGTLLQTGGEPLPSPSAQISGGLRGIAQESLPVSYQQLQR